MATPHSSVTQAFKLYISLWDLLEMRCFFAGGNERNLPIGF